MAKQVLRPFGRRAPLEVRGARHKLVPIGQDLPSDKRRILEHAHPEHQIDAVGDYVRFLQQTPQELDRLFKELLIGVTSFFRDPEAFDALAAALPDLIAMLKRHSSVGMNPRMAAITGTFQILWVIYGISIGSTNIIMWNVIAVVTNYLTVAAYMYFRRQEARS